MSTHLRGTTSILIFWNYYFCASFQAFSKILTSFRRGGFTPTRERTTEIPTQIGLKGFANAGQNPWSENFQISPLQWTLVMKKKTVYLGLFIFESSLGTSIRKSFLTRKGLVLKNDLKRWCKNITAARAARSCMQCLKKNRYGNKYIYICFWNEVLITVADCST